VKKSNKSEKGVRLVTIKVLWKEFNDKVFQGRLLEPAFRITRARGYWAKCVCPDTSTVAKVTIYISGHKHAIAPTGSLSDSLVHEMIHQWQFENGVRHDDNHDETFLKWLPIIKEKLGITLIESWKDE
jgi:hypothetical protein